MCSLDSCCSVSPDCTSLLKRPTNTSVAVKVHRSQQHNVSVILDVWSFSTHFGTEGYICTQKEFCQCSLTHKKPSFKHIALWNLSKCLLFSAFQNTKLSLWVWTMLARPQSFTSCKYPNSTASLCLNSFNPFVIWEINGSMSLWTLLVLCVYIYCMCTYICVRVCMYISTYICS